MIINARKLKKAIREGEKVGEEIKESGLCKMCSPVWQCDFTVRNVLYESKKMRKKLLDMDTSGSISIPVVKIAIISAIIIMAMSLCMCVCKIKRMLKK